MGIFDFFRSGKQNNELPQQRTDSVLLKEKLVRLTGKTDGIVVMEAGASGGEDTVEWAQVRGVKSVYAFEPEPRSFQTLKRKTAQFRNVILSTFGLGKQKGEHTFYISRNENAPESLGVSSSVKEPLEHLNFHPGVKFEDTCTIQIVNLDEWAAESKVQEIDIAWLDMQGGEFDVLVSSPRMLATMKVIFTEVSLKQMYKDAPLYPELRTWLEANGFEVVEEILPWDDMGNVIFRRRGL